MLGYSERSKGYRVYNTETKIVEESIHVRFDDKLDPEKSKLVENFADLEITLAGSDEKTNDSEEVERGTSEAPESTINQKRQRNRQSVFEELILGNKNEPVRTRSTFRTSEDTDRKSTRLNSSHSRASRMPSSA